MSEAQREFERRLKMIAARLHRDPSVRAELARLDRPAAAAWLAELALREQAAQDDSTNSSRASLRVSEAWWADVMGADEAAGEGLDVPKPPLATALARARTGRGYRRGPSSPGMIRHAGRQAARFVLNGRSPAGGGRRGFLHTARRAAPWATRTIPRAPAAREPGFWVC
jgi:hypothetical protein